MLDRRGFLLGSVSFGSLALLPRCGGEPQPEGPPDGTFERPFTEEAPGPHGAEAKAKTPKIYGALTDATRTRLWVEVVDLSTNPPTPHPMQQDHYIEQLYLIDEFGNQIASLGFPYEAQARLIAAVEIPPRVTRIHAYAKCNQTGYWRATYDVAQLAVAPAGDLQRPFTTAQPGPMAAIADKHVPLLGKRPNGSFAVEVGDRAQGKLHETTPQHYIQHVVVFDDSHQIRVSQPLGPAVGEPVVENVNVAGAKKVRVVALCNLHFYWEAEFNII